MGLTNNKRVSMKLVANKAQVSLQTVSRVVNKKDGVSLETRERVQRVIDDLGYRPNRIASAMRGASRTIGVVGYGLEYYGPSRTLIGVVQEANTQGYSVSLQLVQDPENFDAESILGQMLDNKVDAIVCCVPHIGDNFARLQKFAEIITTPILFTDVYGLDADYVVHNDNYQGGRIATRHLIEQGHQTIALISGPRSYASARERQCGWHDELSDSGLVADESLTAEGDWTVKSGAECFRQLIQRNPDITAVFASNDPMALGAIHVAEEKGLKIPCDLAIVGYDNIPEAQFFRPALTTIHQDTVQLGKDAVRHVLHVIEKEQIGEGQAPIFDKLQPELVVRASSVCRTP